MSDQIQTLITNLGVLFVAFLPIIAMRLKWASSETDQIKKYVLEVVAAVALVAGSMFAVYNARTSTAKIQENKIEAVKAAAAHPPADRPKMMKSMGVPQE